MRSASNPANEHQSGEKKCEWCWQIRLATHRDATSALGVRSGQIVILGRVAIVLTVAYANAVLKARSFATAEVAYAAPVLFVSAWWAVEYAALPLSSESRTAIWNTRTALKSET